MTLVIELSDEERLRLEASRINLTALVRGVIASLPAPSPATNGTAKNGAAPDTEEIPDAERSQALRALLQSLIEKAERATPEEQALAETDMEELTYNLNKNRVDAGERPLFPE